VFLLNEVGVHHLEDSKILKLADFDRIVSEYTGKSTLSKIESKRLQKKACS